MNDSITINYDESKTIPILPENVEFDKSISPTGLKISFDRTKSPVIGKLEVSFKPPGRMIRGEYIMESVSTDGTYSEYLNLIQKMNSRQFKLIFDPFGSVKLSDISKPATQQHMAKGQSLYLMSQSFDLYRENLEYSETPKPSFLELLLEPGDKGFWVRPGVLFGKDLKNLNHVRYGRISLLKSDNTPILDQEEAQKEYELMKDRVISGDAILNIHYCGVIELKPKPKKD
ncbi:MAG: hypothetical protein JW787_09100 [Sedimentisphaerales bacterium]|nr:hypothetical protein [Sedimentisphaerales bacterium]